MPAITWAGTAFLNSEFSSASSNACSRMAEDRRNPVYRFGKDACSHILVFGGNSGSRLDNGICVEPVFLVTVQQDLWNTGQNGRSGKTQSTLVNRHRLAGHVVTKFQGLIDKWTREPSNFFDHPAQW